MTKIELNVVYIWTQGIKGRNTAMFKIVDIDYNKKMITPHWIEKSGDLSISFERINKYTEIAKFYNTPLYRKLEGLD